MARELEKLADRIGAMEDEEILNVLEHKKDHTAEALWLAQQEADRRGGMGPLRDRVATESSHAAADPREQEAAATRVSGRLRRILGWAIPKVERFVRYPELRIAVAGLRILALVAALLASVSLIGTPVMVLLSGSDFHFVLFMFAAVFFYSVLALLALLAVQGTIVLLVDTEHSVRTACHMLGQGRAQEKTAPVSADSSNTGHEQ